MNSALIVLTLRKLISIFLIVIFVFNLFGYRALLQLWETQGNEKLEAKLDFHQYDDEDLVEVKIPINLPYHYNWSEFERYDGEIDIDGVHYKYVKRKIFNDSLVLLCIPNEIKTRMSTARDELFSLVNDLQKEAANTHSTHTTISFSLSGGDYICQENEEYRVFLETGRVVYHYPSPAPLISVTTGSPWQPPDLLFSFTS